MALFFEVLQSNGKLSPDRKWKSTGNVGQPRKPFWERLSNSKDPVPTRPMAASLGASMNRRKKKEKEKEEKSKDEEKENEENDKNLSIKDEPTDNDKTNNHSEAENDDKNDEDDKKSEAEEEKEKEGDYESKVDDDKTIDDTGSGQDIPTELQNSQANSIDEGARSVDEHPNGQITFDIRGRAVALRVPPNLRDEWDPDGKLEKPDVDFEVEWVYGYRGKDASGGRNIYQLPTGEMVYHVAAVAILYNLESHTQRHYMGHTNDIECMSVHPGTLALVATGQAEGHDHVNCTIQKPHVQVWNYETLDLAFIVGLEDEFDTGVASVAFSETSLSGYSLLGAIERGLEGVSYLHVWYGIEKGKPQKIGKEIASQTDQVTSLHFYPGRQNVLISTGKGHVNVWTLTKKKDGSEGETELNKKQGLFTRKIDRPSSVTCAAFAKGNVEFLTGDSEGNVMVWKGIRVVRVLKGAHQGLVGDICVIEEDGSFVSGGEKDASLIVFNSEYELIGAGAVLSPQVGGVRAILKRNFTSADGIWFFHLIVGTTLNCIVDVTFSVTPDTTDIQEFEQEILVQGHPGTIYGLTSSLEDQFVSSGEGGSVILWDAAARKAKWSHVLHGEIVNCVTVSTVTGKVAAGTENGILYIGLCEPPGDPNGSGGNSTFKSHHTVSDDGITALSFSPDGTMLAIGSQDSIIYVMQDNLDDDGDLIKLTGHTAGISHIDWSNDNSSLRSNSVDHELLYWKIISVNEKELEGAQITKSVDIDALDSTWTTHNCTLTFETLGAWPKQTDGTDINSCDVSNGTLAVSNDFGTVRIYQYPTNQTDAEYLELLGHSAHVTGIAFLKDHGRLISAGGRESSIIQRTPIISSSAE